MNVTLAFLRNQLAVVIQQAAQAPVTSVSFLQDGRVQVLLTPDAKQDSMFWEAVREQLAASKDNEALEAEKPTQNGASSGADDAPDSAVS